MKDLFEIIMLFVIPVVLYFVINIILDVLITIIPGEILMFGMVALFIAVAYYIIRKEVE